jgi:2-keto-4-pentenoate hydratase
MGSPLNALRWFVKSMMSRGLTVQEGQFVMLGSVVETKWLEAGDFAEVEIDALGSVSLAVE